MISVQGLTKSYGSTDAVRDLTFSVDRGEVVGFLGPNGDGSVPSFPVFGVSPAQKTMP